MKSIFKTMALAVIISPLFLSCSGVASSGSESLLYGNLPAVHGEMQEAKEALMEEYKACESEAKAKSLMEKGDKLGEEYLAKIEEAAKALDGREIKITDGDIKVTAPVSLTFKKFFSKIDMTPYFMTNGGAEAAVDITPDSEYPLTIYQVYIVGYGADGQELFTSNVGQIDAVETDGKGVIKAGTPVKFHEIQFSDKKVKEYQQATSLKLEVR